MIRNYKGKVVAAFLTGAVFASHVMAQATEIDYAAELDENMATVDTVWNWVAKIMIASALVAIAVRFLRKAK